MFGQSFVWGKRRDKRAATQTNPSSTWHPSAMGSPPCPPSPHANTANKIDEEACEIWIKRTSGLPQRNLSSIHCERQYGEIMPAMAQTFHVYHFLRKTYKHDKIYLSDINFLPKSAVEVVLRHKTRGLTP